MTVSSSLGCCDEVMLNYTFCAGSVRLIASLGFLHLAHQSAHILDFLTPCMTTADGRRHFSHSSMKTFGTCCYKPNFFVGASAKRSFVGRHKHMTDTQHEGY